MWFRNSNIVKTAFLLKSMRKVIESSSIFHCCRDGTDSAVLLRKLGQMQTKLIGEIRSSRHKGFARVDIKSGSSVVFSRIFFRKAVSLTLLRFHMQKNRTMQFLCTGQNITQRFQVVSVHWTKIIKPHILKPVASINDRFEHIFGFQHHACSKQYAIARKAVERLKELTADPNMLSWKVPTIYYDGLLDYASGNTQAGMAKIERAKGIYCLCGNAFMAEEMENGLQATRGL